MSKIPTVKVRKRVTVEIEKGGDFQQLSALTIAMGGHIIRTFKNFPYIVVELDEDTLESFAQNEAVINFFEDGEVYTLEQQLPWGIDKIDAEMVHAEYGIKGFGVKVAVIDTGIDLKHPDLKVYGGKSFISSSYQDDHGHGTHVAGTIAALDNTQGVIGVAPEAQLYALKALSSGGSGFWSDVAAALEWSIENKMDIVSMSIGGTAGDSLLETAVTQAYQAGLILVAAAGNSGTSDGTGDSVQFPAKYSGVIAVAATDSNDARASFSSTGLKVELSAPGVNVFSTYLGSTYKNMNGTSMATPHVSGLAALVKSTYPNATSEEIRKKIVDSVVDLGSAGRDALYGYGRISAPPAVEAPGPDIDPPRIFFKSPVAEETISGLAKIEISALDLSGIADLILSINGIQFSRWTSPPYVYYWDTTKVNPGIHYFAVDATDRVGNTAQANQQIKVGSTVILQEPGEGFLVKGITPVKALFTSNALVTRADLYLDDIFRESKSIVDNRVEFTLDFAEVRLSGTSKHFIKIVAFTDEGLQTSSGVNILVRNPVIKIVQPSTNTRITDDATMVKVHATDSGGIEKVEFYIDGALVDTVINKPFSMYLTGLAVGNHTVQTIAYSKTGNIAESNVITVRKATEVSFLSVSGGDVVREKKSVSAKFGDPVGNVEFYLNEQYLGIKPLNGVGPITWTLDTTAYQDLSVATLKFNTWTVKDGVNSTGSITVTIDNYLDVAPPVVYIISPRDGYIVDKPQMQVIAGVGDDQGISFVEFYLNDILVQKLLMPPYEAVYDLTTVIAGKHNIYAKAQDTSGNIGVSGKVEVIKPTNVTVVYPADRTKVSAVINEFKVSCSDEVIGPVNLYIDDVLIQTLQLDIPTIGIILLPCTWDTNQYHDFTEHKITVEVSTVRDSVLSKGSALVTIDNSVDDIVPTVILNSSQEGIVNGTVILTAEASDNKAIERVEFYLNGNLIEDQIFPYEYEWDASKATSGNYSFTAKAYDPAENVGLSNPANMSVPTNAFITTPVIDTHIFGEYNDFSVSFAEAVQGEVNLYIDGEYKATSYADTPTTGPVRISYNWDTRTYLQLTIHEILITANTAKDGILSGGTARVFADNRVDTISPVVNLSASTYKITSGETVTLIATAKDNDEISHVEFYKDDDLVTTLRSTPYEYKWDSEGQNVGKYSFVAKAYDFAGNSTASNQIYVGIATLVVLTKPTDGQVVSATVTSFTAEFGEPVKGYVYLFIDGVKKASKFIGLFARAISIDYVWNTSLMENGSTHIIKIAGYTAIGQVRSEDTAKVTVQN